MDATSEPAEAKPAPKTPAKVTGPRIAAGINAIISSTSKYQTAVFRGNTPLKKGADAAPTPRGGPPATPSRIPLGAVVEDLQREVVVTFAPASRVPSAPVDLVTPRVLEEEPEVEEEAEEEVEEAQPMFVQDAVAAPSPSCRSPPVPEEASHVTEEAPEFRVFQAKDKEPKRIVKAPVVKAPSSKATAVAASSDRLMRGLAPALEKSRTAPGQEGKRPGGARPKVAPAPASGVRKPSPATAQPRPGKENKENRAAASRLPSPAPGATRIPVSPRKGSPSMPSPSRKIREVPKFVLSALGPLSMEENYDLSDKEGSDDDDDVDRSGKFVPSWVRGWPARVRAQADYDPDPIFGPIPRCDLNRIFGDAKSVAARKNRAWRARGSSNDWEADKLRFAEIESYKHQMGQVRRV